MSVILRNDEGVKLTKHLRALEDELRSSDCRHLTPAEIAREYPQARIDELVRLGRRNYALALPARLQIGAR